MQQKFRPPAKPFVESFYPRYIVQYAVVPYNVGIRYFGVIIDGEQHFFLVIGRCRREYFLAEKLAEIRPYRGINGFKRCRA